MEQSFSGYYKDKNLVEVLKTNDVIIVLDPLVLCNLYGFHDDTWKPILSMLADKKELLWLPYKMACTYHRGIGKTLERKIQLLIGLKQKLRDTAESLAGLPFSSSRGQSFRDISKVISKELTREIITIKQRGKKDTAIRTEIANLFKGRVGTSANDLDPQSFRVLTYNEITEADGLSGKDSTMSANDDESTEKVENSNSNDIILHTLIDLSKEKEKNILYVISEPSPYWMVFIGKTFYGPNPEHQCYFEKSSNGKHLYCCTFESFMQKLSVSLGKNLSVEVKSALFKFSYGTNNQNDEW